MATRRSKNIIRSNSGHKRGYVGVAASILHCSTIYSEIRFVEKEEITERMNEKCQDRGKGNSVDWGLFFLVDSRPRGDGTHKKIKRGRNMLMCVRVSVCVHTHIYEIARERISRSTSPLIIIGCRERRPANPRLRDWQLVRNWTR